MYSPKVCSIVRGRKLLFKYAGISAYVYESDEGIYVLKGTKLTRIVPSYFSDTNIWLKVARDLYTDENNIVLQNLLFNSRNRAGVFIYGNAIQASKAFYKVSNKFEYRIDNDIFVVKGDNFMNELLKMFENKCSIFTNYSDFRIFVRTLIGCESYPVLDLSSSPVVDFYNLYAGRNLLLNTGNSRLDKYIDDLRHPFFDGALFRKTLNENLDNMSSLFDSGVALVDEDRYDKLVSELEEHSSELDEDLLLRCAELAKEEISRRVLNE